MYKDSSKSLVKGQSSNLLYFFLYTAYCNVLQFSWNDSDDDIWENYSTFQTRL